MQMLAMIMSFIFGRMNKQTKGIRETAVEIYEEVIEKSRKVVTLTLTGLGATIFFCGGIFIALLDSTTQYDRNGFITMTATLGAGIALMLIASVAFAIVFLRAWPGATKRIEVREEIHHHEASSLEQALSVLVMDFVKEREARRQSSSAPQPSPSAQTSTTRPATGPTSSTTTSTTTGMNNSDIPSSGPIH